MPISNNQILRKPLWRTLLLIVIFLAESLVFGASSCKWLVQKVKSLLNPSVDTAVELEIDTSENALKLLTTVDGKVSGLFESHHPPPLA